MIGQTIEIVLLFGIFVMLGLIEARIVQLRRSVESGQ
jgi:hypothetical protein